jgi:hypothetical protein
MIVVWASETPRSAIILHEIAKAELETQIPADTEDNDLAVELVALKKIIHAQHSV